MQQDKAEPVTRRIPFEDEDGNQFHVMVTSSQGNIPIRIDWVEIREHNDEKSEVTVNYQIDDGHPDCPDLQQIDEQETLRIMATLKEKIPQFAVKVLAEVAEQEVGEEIP